MTEVLLVSGISLVVHESYDDVLELLKQATQTKDPVLTVNEKVYRDYNARYYGKANKRKITLMVNKIVGVR